MSDELLEAHPDVIEFVNRRRERAEAKVTEQAKIAAIRAAVRVSQDTLIEIVQIRFPCLVEMAQSKVEQILQPDVLKFLVRQISAAPDENFVRTLLTYSRPIMSDELREAEPDIIDQRKRETARAILYELRVAVIDVVEGRFPVLADLAKERVEQVHSRGTLHELMKLVVKVPDEETVRWLLNSLAT